MRPLAAIAAALLFSGCVSGKASHQNGLLLFYKAPASFGVGYGETEDLPRGCRFRREVTQSSPALWGDGTNTVHTVTEWDTTQMPEETEE